MLFLSQMCDFGMFFGDVKYRCCNVGLNFQVIGQPAEVSEWFMSITAKLCLNLFKLCLEDCRHFLGRGVYANSASFCITNQAYFLGLVLVLVLVVDGSGPPCILLFIEWYLIV